LFLLYGGMLFIPPCVKLYAQGNNQAYEVRGTVINSVTHEPIARALVTLAGETSSSQLTDNEGRFEFPDIPAGRSVLEAKRPGFFGASSGRDLYQPIAVGPSTTDHILALEPAGSITGQITVPSSDSDGNIRVQLMRRTIQEGRARWQPTGMKLTNSEGSFRFGSLQPGEYRLSTASSIDPELAASQAPVRWGFPAVSYPQEGDSNTVGFLKINPGQQVNVQIALSREPFYSVSIPVANTPLQGYSIQLSDGKSHINDLPVSYDQQAKQFRAWLPSGSYTATIQAFTPQPSYASEAITVRSTPVQAPGLSALPLHPIQVTIHKEFATTNNDAPQMIQIENGRQVEISRDINLMLFSATSEEFVGANLRHEPGGNDSSWVLENVLPGKYWVQTYANQGYVASISAGGTDLTRDPLVIGPGGTTAPIEIVLRNDMATLSIRTKGAIASSSETSSTDIFITHPPVETPLGYLYLVPQFDTTSVVPQSVPLQESANTLNLQPGTYHVLALDRPLDFEYRDPKALEPYTGKGQSVTLEPNGSANIDVDIVPADTAAQ
jgi:hypothetical protein